MPVSTRSQILNNQDENGLIQDGRTILLNEQHRQPHMAHAFRNPHHGLKEKLKSLTLMYEQQKLSSMAVKQQPPKPEEPQLSSIQPVHHLGSSKIEERRQYPPMAVPTPAAITTEATTATTEIGDSSLPDVTVRKTYVSAEDDAKENVATNGDRIIGFTCPRKASVTTNVSRKLSLGSQLETKGISTEIQSKCALLRKQSINRRILVFVRLRPMMKKEKDAGARSCVRIVNRRDVFLTEFATEHDYLRLKRLRGRHFSFDASFPESATQQEVYSTTTAELVESVLEGRNGSVFCYGATGAGKTYTMLGTVESPGVMALAIKDLFNKIRQRSYDGNHAVHLSYLEVYNETVRDLLSPGRPLILREDKQTYVATTYMVGQIQGIIAAGLTQYRAYSTDEVMALLLQGNKNRTTEPTRVNETSSRSHAIFQVMVEYRTKDSSFSMNVVNRIGKLSLIDLAGSERALATDQRTIRSVEGANINRSLLALSSCINALVEGKKHIPYRNSKLTQLLKDSLGGSCNTVMIANISPSSLSFGETQNTLHWADRAKEIRNKASDITEQLVQVLGSPREQAKLLLQVQKENRELRAQLARQQQKLLTIQAQSLAAANSSPAPSTNLNPLLTPQSNSIKQTERRRPKSLAAAYHGGMCHTPDARKRGTLETVRELQQTVIVLESRIERMKIDHAVQLKKKDEKIQELSQKVTTKSSGIGGGGGEEGVKMIVTRASLRPKETNKGDLRISRNRFQSPTPTAKKRSFWDITTANSPSVTTVNGRKTKSHLTSTPAPSMLLQPGFAARQKA